MDFQWKITVWNRAHKKHLSAFRFEHIDKLVCRSISKLVSLTYQKADLYFVLLQYKSLDV